ncbi:MAG: DUF3147 family protein [Micavibrio sp.]|nr:DUF3147 family protein [Micavibrio sp.]MBK9562455.1 DUF3147 family protein [Micavibrio sp.]
MGYLVLKTLLTALIVVAVSEISRRFPLWASLLVSLPLTSILAFIWIYAESKDSAKIIEMSYSVFWLVFPSLAFFLILPLLLKQGLAFPLAMTVSVFTMAGLYAGSVWLYKTFV